MVAIATGNTPWCNLGTTLCINSRDMTHPKYAHEANLDGGSGIHHIPKGSADSHAGK